MELRILGCNGPYPAADGACSGYLLACGETRVLMDVGAGVLGRLMRLCDPALLTAVLLSHAHADHASDLGVLGYYLAQRGARLPLYLPENCGLCPDGAAFDARPFAAAQQVGGLFVRTMPARHPVPAVALRAEGAGDALCYTGDTNECPGLADFCRAAGVLLADACLTDAQWTPERPHLSARRAARLSREAGAKRLILTHLCPATDETTLLREAREEFPGCELARPGLCAAF